MSYTFPAPGVAGVMATLELTDTNNVGAYTGNDPFVISAMTDITVTNARDIFSWTQLDASSKFQVPTTATNSIAFTAILNKVSLQGDGVADGVQDIGLAGLSGGAILVSFSLYMGDESDGAVGTTITGDGYITGLSFATSADAPTWPAPVTIAVTGDLTYA